MSAVLATALKRRTELRAELKRLDNFIKTYRQLSNGGAERSASTGRGPVHLAVAENAERIIRERRAPIPRNDLVAALLDASVALPFADPHNGVGAIMWRDPRFTRLKGLGYWLEGEPLAANVAVNRHD